MHVRREIVLPDPYVFRAFLDTTLMGGQECGERAADKSSSRRQALPTLVDGVESEPSPGDAFWAASGSGKLGKSHGASSAFRSFAGLGPATQGPITGAQLYVHGADDDNGAIDETDVNQRGLGDCYFLASVAALAKQDPVAIARMIQDNGDGTYTVTLWDKHSTWFGLSSEDRQRKITVDANFSTDDKHADPGDNGVEIWPLVLEKAYAQLRGGYGAIGNGGQPGDAMFALTGNDARSYGPAHFAGRYAPPDRGWAGGEIPAVVTWDNFKAAFDAKKMITVTSWPGSGKGGGLDFGIHDNHVYTVDSFYVDATGRKMVHLRNPWGFESADVPWDQLARIAKQVTVGG